MGRLIPLKEILKKKKTKPIKKDRNKNKTTRTIEPTLDTNNKNSQKRIKSKKNLKKDKKKSKNPKKEESNSRETPDNEHRRRKDSKKKQKYVHNTKKPRNVKVVRGADKKRKERNKLLSISPTKG